MVTELFDDHYESLVHWREAGLRGLTCLHVDAHLDVMDTDFHPDLLAGVAAAQNREELEPFRTDGRLPWGGGCHCGNYLYPALLDGTVKELIWLLPPHVLKHDNFLDSVRHETQRWVDLTFDEWRGMTLVEGRVEGTLAGVKFVVCTTESLPTLTAKQRQNLALDIDVDYFIRLEDDALWQTPHELQEALGEMTPKALTIAYSVEGGYTPLGDRYLGEVTLSVFSGEPKAWEDEVDQLIDLEGAAPAQRQAGLEQMLKTSPKWMRPSLLVKLGREEEAGELDPAFKPNPLNQMARLLQKKEFDEGLEGIGSYPEGSDKAYLETFFALGAKNSTRAQAALDGLQEVSQRPAAAVRLLTMKASLCCDMGEYKEALALMQQALKLDREAKDVHYQLYRAQLGLGNRKQAARAMRKALRLAEDRLSSLQMMVDAAKLYDQMGQNALAKALRKKIKECDVIGSYAVRTMLDEVKIDFP